jgi:zinc transport system substrate-binding protein
MRKQLRSKLRTAASILVAFLCCMLALCPAAPAEAKSPVVLVTIRPITSLVAAVMAGVGRPETLIPAKEPVENFELHDQDESVMRQADLIFWVGPSLETALAKPFANVEIGARIVELSDTDGLLIFPPRHGGEWDLPPARIRAPGEGGGPAGADGHLWLDADNAKLLVGRIASALTDVDFSNAEVYRTNAAALRKRIDALDDRLTQMLAPLHDRPYLLLSDDFQYFEARYGLEGAGSVTLDSGPPAADKLKEVTAKIARLHTDCVVGDFDTGQGQLQAIADSAKVKSARIDLYGTAIPEGPDLYFKAMQAIAASFVACLGAG